MNGNQGEIKLAVPIGYEASTILHRAALKRLAKYKDEESKCQQEVKRGKMKQVIEPISNGIIIRYEKVK